MLAICGPQLYPPDMYEERRGCIKSTEGEAHLVEFRASTGALFGVLVLCLVFSISAMLMWKWIPGDIAGYMWIGVSSLLIVIRNIYCVTELSDDVDHNYDGLDEV